MIGPTTPEKTVRLIPLTDLIALARLGQTMRRAQQAFFDRKKQQPHIPADAEWRATREAERAFDSAAADALARERQSLPFTGAEGGDAI